MTPRRRASWALTLLRLGSVLALALGLVLSIGRLATATGVLSAKPSPIMRVSVAWGALTVILLSALAVAIRRRPSVRFWAYAAWMLAAASYALLVAGDPAALPGLGEPRGPFGVLWASGLIVLARPVLELGALAAVTASILAEVPRGRRHGDSWRVYSARRPPRRRPRWKSVRPDTKAEATTGSPSSTTVS